jgi:hypothetical protein
MSVDYSDINALSRRGVYVVLLKLSLPPSQSAYITSNGSSVVFEGNTYLPLPFSFDTLEKKTGGQNPSWAVHIENVNGVVLSQMLQYESERKASGGADDTMSVTVYGVNALDVSKVVMEETFDLERWECPPPGDKVSFVFGGDNPTSIRYPRNRFRSNFCDRKLGSSLCGYTGPGSCSKTLATCRALGNASSFGGFPGLTQGVLV